MTEPTRWQFVGHWQFEGHRDQKPTYHELPVAQQWDGIGEERTGVKGGGVMGVERRKISREEGRGVGEEGMGGLERGVVGE